VSYISEHRHFYMHGDACIGGDISVSGLLGMSDGLGG
jgi:hypothetical protein